MQAMRLITCGGYWFCSEGYACAINKCCYDVNLITSADITNISRVAQFKLRGFDDNELGYYVRRYSQVLYYQVRPDNGMPADVRRWNTDGNASITAPAYRVVIFSPRPFRQVLVGWLQEQLPKRAGAKMHSCSRNSYSFHEKLRNKNKNRLNYLPL